LDGGSAGTLLGRFAADDLNHPLEGNVLIVAALPSSPA
jgi:hypothetical protein